MKKKILFVCPTNRWNTRERSLLNDIQIALKDGHHVLFYGLEGSPLDKRIKKEDVEKYYHPGVIQTHFFLWPKLSRLSILLEDTKLTLVHCYKLNILWPICFFLRGNKDVSLVLSQFFELKKNYKNIWHKLLIRRCDLIFTPYEQLIKNIWSCLGVHPRKIIVRPPTINNTNTEFESGVIFEKFEQFYSIGVYISDSDDEIEKFFPFVKALIVSNDNFDWKKPIKLVFVTEGPWSEKKIYQGLKRRILDEGIEEHIVFYTGGTPADYIQHFDIWMSPPVGEGLDDLALLATSIGTPILVPRHASCVEFFSKYGSVGECYHQSDVREIVRKWELILSEPDKYQESIELASQRIRDSHSQIKHKNQYVSAIRKIIARREAYRERKSPSRSL